MIFFPRKFSTFAQIIFTYIDSVLSSSDYLPHFFLLFHCMCVLVSISCLLLNYVGFFFALVQLCFIHFPYQFEICYILFIFLKLHAYLTQCSLKLMNIFTLHANNKRLQRVLMPVVQDLVLCFCFNIDKVNFIFISCQENNF